MVFEAPAAGFEKGFVDRLGDTCDAARIDPAALQEVSILSGVHHDPLAPRQIVEGGLVGLDVMHRADVDRPGVPRGWLEYRPMKHPMDDVRGVDESVE
jgi:hypothetical protein